MKQIQTSVQVKGTQQVSTVPNEKNQTQQTQGFVKQIGTNGKIIQPNRPQRSWELQKKDPTMYKFINQENKTLVKLPGSIAGEQFVIQNCIKCDIYLIDHSNTVYIDDCIDCRIYVGPVESSVFIRDCVNCKCVIACGQFRTRKCEDLKILLMCQSQPIIESSLRIGFGCFRAAYPELEIQFEQSKLDRWNNTWSDIFDFTKNFRQDNNHFYMLSDDLLFEDMLPPMYTVYKELTQEYEQNMNNQVVPFTYEKRVKVYCDQILLVFFPETSKKYDMNKFTQHFQPLPNQQQLVFVEERQNKNDPDEVIIDAPETAPFFLIKSKHAYLYLDNLELFKSSIVEYSQLGQKLLNQLINGERMQKLFSLHIRTDDNDIDLLSYMRSLISQYFNLQMSEACITIREGQQIENLSNLVFANMQDMKGEKPSIK